jgi:Dyp-type peroxidase family
VLNGSSRFSPAVDPPAAFRLSVPNPVAGQPDLPDPPMPLPAATVVDSDVLFYVASVYEARVNQFVTQLAAMTPDVQAVTLNRGYQRLDGTEPFGYADGLRNIRSVDRPRFVFVHRDERQLEEPEWADGGSYMAFMRILQQSDSFEALSDDNARDTVIGRQKDGTRLDLVGEHIAPRDEPSEPAPNLQPTAHVRKAGPRERHDDTQIFRRGLPFMETTTDGHLRVGLNFCSFQGSLEQLDVILNDWITNPRFPTDQGGGPDALLDPGRGLTVIEKAGVFFVPPYEEAGLAAALFKASKDDRDRHKTGKLVARKRVTDPSDPSKRFERGGFVFQVVDSTGQPVGGQFTSDSTGRAIAPVELKLDESYTLQELGSPVPNVQLTNLTFDMDKRHKELLLINQVTQPNTPYGG